jgi:ABC-type protease/lipase transport system fused ATPase/permease subunit
MRNLPKFAVVVGVLLSAAVPASAAKLTYDNLVGSWKVTAVAVDGDGVQALVDNDPQYMGAIVQFGPNGVEWTKGTKARPIDASRDNCPTAPSVKASTKADDESYVKGGYNLICGSNAWGVAVPVNASTVKLYWFDNGILTLKRQK